MLQPIATNRRISLTDLNGAVQYCTAAIHTNKQTNTTMLSDVFRTVDPTVESMHIMEKTKTNV